MNVYKIGGTPEPPKIEFRKINPTRYIVDVKSAKGPFTLVFSESFHEGWKAFIRPVQSSKFKVKSHGLHYGAHGRIEAEE
ncbi:MAG: hypothetical protein HY755_01390 [Nitrospirae bacterium]|nr:hypothetical protein [Nitrospirota bacterium]